MMNKKNEYVTPALALLSAEDVIMASQPMLMEEGEGDFGFWVE